MKKILKLAYMTLSPVIYLIKYPTCKIDNSFVHPTVKLGKSVVMKSGCRIGKNIEVGGYTFINEFTRIDANTSKIGKYCSISHNVKIGMGPHPLHFISTSPVFYSKARGYIEADTYDEFEDKGYTEIGHDVFIAANAVIYAGLKIGTGSVVSAGSIVTKDVPPYAVVAGMPARIIKYRFDEYTIERLLRSQWWEYSNDRLLKYYKYMSNPKQFLKVIGG